MTNTFVRTTMAGAFLLTAAAAGALSAKSAWGIQVMLLTAAAAGGSVLMIKAPAMTPAALWVGYSLAGTVFGVSVEGLFYPLYAIMLVNSALYLCTRAPNPFRNAAVLQITAVITTFLAIAAVALVRPDNATDEFPFAIYQRMFVYSMSLIGAMQFWIDLKRRYFLVVVALFSVALSIWVILSANQSGFGYRARTGVNENYVAEIVAVGLLPVLAALITERGARMTSRLALVLALLTGVYALLLLASRGMCIAFGAAAAFAIAHQTRRASTLVVTALAAVIALAVLSQLPGSDAIVERFHSNDVYTLNDRTAIWSAVWSSIRDDSFAALLFGHGFGSSNTLVRNHLPMYTSVHNSYLQILFEFGAAGLLAFLGCHLIPLILLVRRRDPMSVASASMLVFLMACALTGAESDNFQYWLVLAFAAAISCIPPTVAGEQSVRIRVPYRVARHSLA